MKNFLFTLFVLAVLAGAGFYFGWAQAKVPPGSYGVLRSKTHGTDPQVIKEGEFRWVWYKLIPTNAETIVFNPRRISRPLNASGFLPSGRQYANLAGMDADFFWRISGEFSFVIRPESLPALTEKENFTDESAFRAYEDRCAANIEAFIQQSLVKLGEDDAKMESFLASHSLAEISSGIETAFPEIEDFDCFVSTIDSPDFTLYRAFKALNEDYLNQFRLALSDNALRDVESRIAQRQKFDELALIGDLLTRFPAEVQLLLLDYLMARERSAVP